MGKFKIPLGLVLLLFGCVTMATAAKQSYKTDLSEVPEGELPRLRQKAEDIYSKMNLDLGKEIHANKKPTATKADHKKQIALTKKMVALKLFMHDNEKEQRKRRWTQDADDGVSGQAEWDLEYSDNDETWKAVNPVKKFARAVREPMMDIKPPSISSKPPQKSVEPSHDHHQIPMSSKKGPAPGSTARVAAGPSRPTVKKSPERPKRLPAPAPLPDFYHSDHDTAKDDKKDDDILIMTLGGTALILATLFMIFTTIQWIRSLEALRKSEAAAHGAEIVRLLEEEGDPELGIPSLKKDYVTLDFDGLIEMDDLPTQAPAKPSRRAPTGKKSQESCSRMIGSRSSIDIGRSSTGSDPMFPNEVLREKAPEKPPRRFTNKKHDY